MFTKPPFTYFQITLIQIHFAKTTLGFSVIIKIPFLLVLLNFQKFHIAHTSVTLTNAYFTLTNYKPSLQINELSQISGGGERLGQMAGQRGKAGRGQRSSGKWRRRHWGGTWHGLERRGAAGARHMAGEAAAGRRADRNQNRAEQRG
jgi:hypothetical protein